MIPNYLHHHKDFKDLLLIVSEERGIDPILVEKDYWIMHCLFALKQAGYMFELKGGTSLSKAFKIIDRFSEDIDMHIHPPTELAINENPKNTNPNNIQKRLSFYNKLANEIEIDGIELVERDTNFDNTRNYSSGGIRLFYPSFFAAAPSIKEGILLEVGFDTVNPNSPMDISSWVYDKANESNVNFLDNIAKGILCYDIRYTFVEKLQTITTKFRIMQQTGEIQVNFMRQYYDVYNLLQLKEIESFIGSEEYHQHKNRRFPTLDLEIPLYKNQAFLLEDQQISGQFKKLYLNSSALYYNDQPDFQNMIDYIKTFLPKL